MMMCSRRRFQDTLSIGRRNRKRSRQRRRPSLHPMAPPPQVMLLKSRIDPVVAVILVVGGWEVGVLTRLGRTKRARSWTWKRRSHLQRSQSSPTQWNFFVGYYDGRPQQQQRQQRQQQGLRSLHHQRHQAAPARTTGIRLGNVRVHG